MLISNISPFGFKSRNSPEIEKKYARHKILILITIQKITQKDFSGMNFTSKLATPLTLLLLKVVWRQHLFLLYSQREGHSPYFSIFHYTAMPIELNLSRSWLEHIILFYLDLNENGSFILRFRSQMAKNLTRKNYVVSIWLPVITY